MTPLELSRRWMITGFVFMLLIILAAFLGLEPGAGPAPKPLLSEVLLYNLQGEVVKIPPDQAKVIHLWRGGCEACLGDMALLERVATSGRYPVTFYFVNTGDDLELVRSLSKAEVWAERVLSDESGKLVELSTTLPATLFFNATGELHAIKDTFMPETALSVGELERYLDGISD